MQTLTANPKVEIDVFKKQQRNATVILTILGVVYLAALGIYGVIYQQQSAWQFLVMVGIALALSLAAFIGAVLSRAGRPHLGILFYLPFFWFLFPPGAYLVAGIGLAYGVAALLATAPVVFSTLPRRVAGWMLLPSAASGVITILLDLYGPAGRPEVPGLSTSITLLAIVAVVVLVAVGGGIALIRNINNFSFIGKFAVIAALFTVPLVVATSLLVLTQYDRIDKYGYREKYGAQYLRPLQGILSEAVAYEWLTVERAGEVVDVQALSRTQVRIDEYFQQLAAVEAEHGQLLESTEAFEQLRDDWETVKAEALSSPVLQRRAQQERFLTDLQAAIALVGDTSFLILDPEIETYYLMDGVLIVLPTHQATLSRLLALNEEITARRPLTLDEQAETILVADELGKNIARLQRDLGVVTNGEGKAYEALHSALADLSFAVGDTQVMLQKRIGSSSGITIAPENFEATAKRLLAASQTYYDLNSQALEADIDERIANDSAQMWATVAVAVLAGTFAAIVGQLLIRAIGRPMLELTGATGQLASGDLSARVTVRYMDEVGRLGVAFNDMAERLQTSQTEIAERAKALATNLEVSRRLSTVLDPQRLLVEVVEQLQSAFGYYHAHIYLWDADRQYLRIAGGTGEPGRLLLASGHKLARGRGLVGRAAETNQVVLVPNTTADPNWVSNVLLPDTKSEVAVPIAVGDRVIGVLDVQQNRINGLTERDATLLQALANQVAIALQNAQSFERTQRQAEQQQKLNLIGQKIQAAPTVEAVLEIAARELGQALGAQRAEVQLGTQPLTNGSATRTGNGNGHA
jgi:putative methionine-R-sulfoxide reductase with GAF domain